MKATLVEIQKYLESLQDTPHRMEHITRGFEKTFLQAKSDKKSWSVNDILAHLRACADVWTHSIYAMLAEREPVLPDINERKWANITGYADVPFSESFQVFCLQRENLLRVLRVLPHESWERSAMILGRKHTVFTQVRRMAKHETEHCEQIESLLQKIAQR